MRNLILLLLCAAACETNPPAGQPPESGSSRQQIRAERPLPVLIGFRQGVDRAAITRLGGRVHSEWPEIRAAGALLPAEALAALSANPNVEYVEADREVTALTLAGSGEETWGNVAVGADRVRASSSSPNGSGVTLCIIDSGVDPNHPELSRTPSLFGPGYDYVDKDTTPYDGTGCIGGNCASWGTGHGTHVTGTLAAQLEATGSNPPNGAGVVGVAPGITVVEYRVLGTSGSGSTSSVVSAITACKAKPAPRIASLSLGSKFKSRTEQRAFDDAYRAGVLSFAAAGNSGDGSTTYPAGYASVVSVAAVDANLQRASFSQSNKDVELTGPGVDVLSSVPRGQAQATLVQVGATRYPSNPLEYSGQADVTGPLVSCGLCDSTHSCGVAAAGFVAYCDRGSITFALKTQNAAAQGAAAVIIANNDLSNPDDPGNFTLGGAGNWPPVASISYHSGQAIVTNGAFGSATRVLNGSSDYAHFSGTSMATPHASGCAALAWSTTPALTHEQLRERLGRTAVDLGTKGRDSTFGFGLLDCYRASFGPF